MVVSYVLSTLGHESSIAEIAGIGWYDLSCDIGLNISRSFQKMLSVVNAMLRNGNISHTIPIFLAFVWWCELQA
jgi:hypothetical protein